MDLMPPSGSVLRCHIAATGSALFPLVHRFTHASAVSTPSSICSKSIHNPFRQPLGPAPSFWSVVRPSPRNPSVGSHCCGILTWSAVGIQISTHVQVRTGLMPAQRDYYVVFLGQPLPIGWDLGKTGVWFSEVDAAAEVVCRSVLHLFGLVPVSNHFVLVRSSLLFTVLL